MKSFFLLLLVLAFSLLSSPVFSQSETKTEADTALLGLPGDNLDLYAVMDLFQKSKTIEDFEKSLNTEKTGINNLDLNLDKKVDFIKVVTKQDKNDFTFILQVDVSEKEKQDVAVILVSKDAKGKVTMQIVGDKALYGKDYVIEPKPATPAATANPGYAGSAPVTSTAASTNTVVVVESAPVVQYVYSPVYVPYYPPYTYVYHPPYFAAFTVMAIGIYRHNNYYNHYGYHGGGHGNTVIINNQNNFNNYNNNSRNSSNTVNHNNSNGNYSRNNASTRPSTNSSAGQSKGKSAGAKPSTGMPKASTSNAKPSTGLPKGSSATAKPSTSQSNRSSASTRPATSSSSRPSTSNYSSSSGSRSNSRPSSSSRGGGGGGGRRR